MSLFNITNYHIGRIRHYSKFVLIGIVAIFILGTATRPIFKNRITVKEADYILKEGFPLFTSQKAYINLLKHYPYKLGTKLTFHVMQRGESFWDVANANNISIDTLVSANPFITSLISTDGMEIAIPADDGVLTTCDNVWDPWRMSKLLGMKGQAKGDYIQGIFDLFCLDDVRFVFFKGARPAIVNQHLEGLFEIKKSYHLPCAGQLVSLYGMRLDPFLHTPDFHEGLDIRAPYGTPIRPIKEGMVISAGWHEGFGNCIEIIHPDGYLSIYGHCSEVNVEKGMIVSKDDIIGRIGSTGRSTGPHLHFEMRRHGENVNPLFFIW